MSNRSENPSEFEKFWRKAGQAYPDRLGRDEYYRIKANAKAAWNAAIEQAAACADINGDAQSAREILKHLKA